MQQSFSNLEYAGKNNTTRRERFLNGILATLPWSTLVVEFEAFYPKGGKRGRPPTRLERILPITVAQQCFGLSDEGIEDAVYDSHAIRQFFGIHIGP